MIIPPQYDQTFSRFSEGLAAVSIGNILDLKFGFIDQTGKMVIPPQYRWAHGFGEGLAGVMLADLKWGFIDKVGRMVIPPGYDGIGGSTRG
jgi:hypothetical protein